MQSGRLAGNRQVGAGKMSAETCSREVGAIERALAQSTWWPASTQCQGASKGLTIPCTPELTTASSGKVGPPRGGYP